jgi:phage terminase small subunit
VTPKDTAVPAGAADEWAKKLDDKERLFVEGYLQTLNKRQAAEYAGYSDASAKRYAHEIFRRAHVREAIEHLLRTRSGVTKTWLVDKLVSIIDTDLADVSDWDLDGDLVFKGSADLTPEQKVAVAEVVQERSKDGGKTLKLKLYDKLSAMAHLAKLLNLLVDRQEISGPNGGPVEVTDHRARIMDRLNAIAKRQAPDNDGAPGGP